MTQIVVLHTIRSTQDASDYVGLLQRQGYEIRWDAEMGGMVAIGARTPVSAPCVIVLWTKDAPASRWVWDHALEAKKRNALVEVMIEKMDPPFEGAVPPLDFTDVVDGKLSPAQTRALIQRVEAKTGQPVGKLPLRKQAEPMMVVTVSGFVMASFMATGGIDLPSSDGLTTRQIAREEITPDAVGGPTVSPRNLVVARFEEAGLKPTKVHVRHHHYKTIPLARVLVGDAVEAYTPVDSEEIVINEIRIASPS